MPKAKPKPAPARSTFSELSLGILAFAALTGLLTYMRPVLLPFVIALFLYFALSPTVEWFEKRLKIRNFFALLLTGMIGMGLVAGLGAMAVASVRDFVSQSEAYKGRLVEGLGQLALWAEAHGMAQSVQDLREALENLPVFTWVSRLTGSVVGMVSTLALVAVFLFFLLGSERTEAKKHQLFNHASLAISRYLQVKILASLATGLVTWLALWMLGVDLAVLFGILAFFFNFIPNLGGLVTVLLPLPVAFAQFGASPMLLAVLLVPAIPQALISNVMETKYLGDSLGLHPVAVLLALLFWGMIWGLPGMFLAVPITSVLKIALEGRERTRPFAKLMAGDLE